MNNVSGGVCHLLESPLQGLVLLNVLLVLLQSGRSDAPQLSPSQHRLQQIARIHRPFLRPCPDHRVDLVDEQDDLSLRTLYLGQDSLQSFFKLPAVFRTRDERTHIEREQLPPFECLRHIPTDDPLGQPLGDGRLAHARFTQEDGVILGTSGEDLDGSSDLLVTADDRIQFALRGGFCEVSTVLLQRLVRHLRVARCDLVVPSDSHDRVLELCNSGTSIAENVFRDAIGVGHCQQDMLHADELIIKVTTELASFRQAVAHGSAHDNI